MRTFIGREHELNRLEHMYASDHLEVAVIYGRRRVGKTTLINQFCKGKRAIFFAAQENDAFHNLSSLSETIMQEDEGGVDHGIAFISFESAFDKIANMALEQRLIFVIDEYPYLAKADNSISSILQNYIDHRFQNTKLFLILCGSSMSFMEHQVLGYQSPLYGRRTAQFKVKPFDYYETTKWFPGYSREEQAVMYGVTGGIPMYLQRFSDQKTVKENLLDELFDENALLFDEPSNLLKQELREPAIYNAIIESVAAGSTKLSEIAGKVKIETGTCTKYITNLIELGILKRELPITDLNSKRPIYLIDDMFFKFWYTFIPRNRSAIISRRIATFYDRVIEPGISDYMGSVFEKMCKDYIAVYDMNLPFEYSRIGQWWGGNPKTKKQAQIDVVVLSSDERELLIGSCKYTNKKVGMSEYALMQEYGDILNGYEKKYIYLFSKTGFEEPLKVIEDIRLVTLEDMFILQSDNR